MGWCGLMTETDAHKNSTERQEVEQKQNRNDETNWWMKDLVMML